MLQIASEWFHLTCHTRATLLSSGADRECCCEANGNETPLQLVFTQFCFDLITSENMLHFHCINKSVFLLSSPGSGSIEIPVLCVLIAGDATVLEVITLVYFIILI